MTTALPFGTKVQCLAHENFEPTDARILGFDTLNEKYYLQIKEENIWLPRELVAPATRD